MARISASESESNATQLSPQAHKRLSEELQDLTTRGRVEIARIIETARELGDLKENGDYHAAKEEQGKMEARIRQLEHLLEKAEISEQLGDAGMDGSNTSDTGTSRTSTSKTGTSKTTATKAAKNTKNTKNTENTKNTRDSLTKTAKSATKNSIQVGSVITLLHEDEDEAETYLLASVEEEIDGYDLLSPKSPLGVALLGAKPGDVVSYEVPQGRPPNNVFKVEVKSISQPA